MSRLWSQLHELFDTDDRSLPGIELNNLTAEEIENIYAYLRLNSKIVSRGSYFWSITTQEEVPVDSVENAASLVVIGEAECFLYCCRCHFWRSSYPRFGDFCI